MHRISGNSPASPVNASVPSIRQSVQQNLRSFFSAVPGFRSVLVNYYCIRKALNSKISIAKFLTNSSLITAESNFKQDSLIVCFVLFLVFDDVLEGRQVLRLGTEEVRLIVPRELFLCGGYLCAIQHVCILR